MAQAQFIIRALKIILAFIPMGILACAAGQRSGDAGIVIDSGEVTDTSIFPEFDIPLSSDGKTIVDGNKPPDDSLLPQDKLANVDIVDQSIQPNDTALDSVLPPDSGSGGWIEVPGAETTQSEPLAIIDGHGKLHLFIRGSTNAIHENIRTGSVWSGWTMLPGIPGSLSPPHAILDTGGKIHLFIRGMDDGIYEAINQNGWGTWTKLDGVMVDSPAAILDKKGLLRLFVRGKDNLLYENIFTTLGGWQGWSFLKNSTTLSGPSASIDNIGYVRLFRRTTLDGLEYSFINSDQTSPTWSSWITIAGSVKIMQRPSVLMDAKNNLTVFIRGEDDYIWKNVRQSSVWQGWQRVSNALKTMSGPMAILDGAVIRIFVRGADDGIYYLTDL